VTQIFLKATFTLGNPMPGVLQRYNTRIIGLKSSLRTVSRKISQRQRVELSILFVGNVKVREAPALFSAAIRMQGETDGAFLVLFHDKNRQGSTLARCVLSTQPWVVRPAAMTASVLVAWVGDRHAIAE
jgi:hypothetical protein